MAWSRARRSARKARLPDDWAQRRHRVLVRDGHTCQLRYPGMCVGRATDVDHDDTGSDDLDHLRSACSPCHARRSSQQGVATRQRQAARRHRPTESPPGLLPRAEGG